MFSFVQSQVTIGSGKRPARAALLDLKEQEATNDNVTANKGGLVLPRVRLENKKTLDPFINSQSDPEWLNSPAKVKKEHVGLMAYNLNTSNGFAEGIYVWDGAGWNKAGGDDSWNLSGNAGTDPAANYIGTSDASDLSIKTNNKEAMRITAQGEVSLKNIPLAPPTASTSQLVVDNATGILQAIGTATNNKMFNYIKYEIDNVEGDWIKNFDTKIPKDDYTLVVIGSSFSHPIQVLTGTKDGKSNDEKVNSYNWYAPPMEVYAFSDGSTWRLYADYGYSAAMDPVTNKPINGKWIIHCLSINNTVVKKLEDKDFIFNMNGKPTGGAPNKPNGL
ncbi:hypothetical protein FACS189414_4220 [Bacteroidia bacterium]|nr:hypothetical protein AGMMS49574_25310 [Bacteroidia bacterium]GHU77239.1 hypothetical protein FACS189414_4220 [Bacteroidia bacterium]